MQLDAHQHYWTYSRDAADHGWIGADMDVLRRDCGPADLAPLLSEIGFDGAVAVQARELKAENDALLALAESRLSADEQAAITGHTCQHFYRIAS